MAGSSKWSHWLETTELRKKKRSTSSNQSLQNSVSERGQPWSSKYTVSLHSPDTSLGTGPNKVAGDCVLSLSMWGQYGLIRVYDFKISCDAVGFITWLHEKRIIWDILIKQLSEQKEKKNVGLREVILFVDSNLRRYRKNLWLMKFSRVPKRDGEAATPWTSLRHEEVLTVSASEATPLSKCK